jgi:hypothetical protein
VTTGSLASKKKGFVVKKEGILMRWFFPLALVGAALAVSGCSTTLTDTQVKTIHHVAVVSMLGETFHGIEIANSGLRGAHYDANVIDWRLDDDIREYVLTQLAASGLAARQLDISPKGIEDFYSKPLVSNDHIFIQGYAPGTPLFRAVQVSVGAG